MIADKYREIIMKLNDEDLVQLIKYANIGKGKVGSEESNSNYNSGIRLTATAQEKYKVLKAKTERGERVDSEDLVWLNKIDCFKNITSIALPNEIAGKSEKDTFRYIYYNLLDNNVSETMAKTLTMYLTDYVISGKMKKPLLLVGNPGCGKTELARIIARIIGRPLYSSSPTQSDRKHGLRGEGSSFKSPDMGEIFRADYENNCNNPVILFDEVSACIKSDNQVNFEDDWLNILDRESMPVTDSYLELTKSLDRSLLIFTDNYLDNISLRFQDRCVVCKVLDVELDRMTKIISKYITAKIDDSMIPINYSEDELFRHVHLLYSHNIHSIRKMKDMVDFALNNAKTRTNLAENASDNMRVTITHTDFEEATSNIIVNLSKNARKIGY